MPGSHFLCVFEAHKSGMPHLHILWRGPYIDQRWLSAQMARRIDSPIVDIRRVNHQKHAASYIAKYCSKAPERFDGCKRYWRTMQWAPNWESATTRTNGFGGSGWRTEFSLHAFAHLLASWGWRIDSTVERVLHAHPGPHAHWPGPTTTKPPDWHPPPEAQS